MTKLKRLVPFLPPVILMGLIFFASSQQSIGVSGSFYVNFIIFKSLHMIVYGLLYLFWRLALYNNNYGNEISILLSLSYGIIDEVHQSFVPTRDGTLRDVFINLIGILIFFGLFDKFILPKLKRIDLLNQIYNLS